LFYADDIIILVNTQLERIQTMEKLMRSSKGIGLIINETETKYMVMSRNLEDMTNLKVGHFVFEQVEGFKYLEVNINHRNNMHSKVR